MFFITSDFYYCKRLLRTNNIGNTLRTLLSHYKVSHRTCQGYTSNHLGYLRTIDLIKLSVHTLSPLRQHLSKPASTAYYTGCAVPSSQVTLKWCQQMHSDLPLQHQQVSSLATVAISDASKCHRTINNSTRLPLWLDYLSVAQSSFSC